MKHIYVILYAGHRIGVPAETNAVAMAATTAVLNAAGVADVRIEPSDVQKAIPLDVPEDAVVAYANHNCTEAGHTSAACQRLCPWCQTRTGSGQCDDELCPNYEDAELVVNMNDVATALEARGVQARVEMTGGGCATILIGTPAEDHYDALAGPGSFDKRGVGFCGTDFSWGPDNGIGGYNVIPFTRDAEAWANAIAAWMPFRGETFMVEPIEAGEKCAYCSHEAVYRVGGVLSCDGECLAPLMIELLGKPTTP